MRIDSEKSQQANSDQSTDQSSHASVFRIRPVRALSIAGAETGSQRPQAVFTLDEAREVLPVVFRLTRNYKQQVDALIRRADMFGDKSDVESRVQALIREWESKIERLGGHPQGLWIADFDAGNGYFCWRYPERNIEHWHQYQDGFTKRRLISQVSLPGNLASQASRAALAAAQSAGNEVQDGPCS